MLESAQKLGNLLAGVSGGISSTPKSPTLGNTVFFQIKPFKDNDRGINHWETVSKNLISLKKKQLTFLIRGNSRSIKFFVGLPKDFKQFFQSAFYASFPTSDLLEVETPQLYAHQEYIIGKDSAPVLSKDDFVRDGTYMDPMTTILSLYNTIDADSSLDIVFTYTFKVKKNFLAVINDVIKRFRTPKSKEGEDGKDEKKEKKPDLFMTMGYHIKSKDKYLLETTKANIKSAFATFFEGGKIKVIKKAKKIAMTYDQSVNFFHLPTVANFTKGLEYTLYRKLPYPTNLPTSYNTPNADKDLTILGTTDYRGDNITFGIRKEDKFRHMYIMGKTGTGKSTLISNLIASDMQAGNGLCLLDPHGELVDTVLEYIPSHRINDVILFDVADSDFPIGFNLLQADTEEERNLVASGVVSTFKKLFGNSRGPRLEYILRNIVLSLVDYPNATLMHILRMLTDKNFREEVVSCVKDSVVLKFWNNEFNKRNDKQREEAAGPITNKVGQFLSSKLVRNIFGQPRTKLNLRKAMDEGKIILVNLSKGRIGEDNANMIGSLLVTKFQIDAMSRADIPAHLRREFYLYIDEFQNFASESFTTILSEARKYKLALIVANQYISQLMPEIKDAIFGNVGTTVCMTIGSDDASQMTSQFKNMAEVNDLISLPKYTAYTRLMIDGISSDPFSMKTLPPIKAEGSLETIDKVRKQSRQRYAMSRGQLEKLMQAWSNKTFSVQEKVAEKAKLESLGISSEEAENLQDMFVQQHLHMFTEYAIDGVEPDAILFDTDSNSHKTIWWTKPKGLDDQANLKYKAGTHVPLDGGKKLDISVDMYQHQTMTIENTIPLAIWIGSKEHVLQQFDTMLGLAGNVEKFKASLKFCPNTTKLEAFLAQQEPKAPENNIVAKPTSVISSPAPQAGEGAFDISHIKLGESYDGYVKLSYNYGMFVTVKGVEGLLHKNFIVAPDGVDWKKYYNIGDKIRVKASEFKEINGDKKVVWSQK
ncbi:hypothetical protein P148_SR1C00001G0221 [candidate division SR1 bacterium RAAC1_SR1_1]|nr:hypothetical protein P148_SR1C00001G0221 [candidate division SR1 bacterium RAAC1_SR1_1]